MPEWIKWIIFGFIALGLIANIVEWARKKFSREGKELKERMEKLRQENPQPVPEGGKTVVVVKRRGCLKLAFIAFVAIVLLYPLKDGDSIRDAAKNKIVQQVPYAIDILAARYPLKVGLLRSLMNDQGQMDNAAKDYVRSKLNFDQTGGIFYAYFIYYFVGFEKDEVRKAMADKIEKDLGLQ